MSGMSGKIGQPLELPDNYEYEEKESRTYIFDFSNIEFQLLPSRSRGVLQSIWQTKEQLGPDDPVDVQIKTTLKELVTYIIFFSVLLVGEYRANIRQHGMCVTYLSDSRYDDLPQQIQLPVHRVSGHALLLSDGGG